MITLKTLINELRQAFGEKMKLPFAICYSQTPAGEEVAMPHCMFEALPMIEQGKIITFSAEKLHCGGGRLYCGYNSYNPAIGRFVSGKEYYKKTPEMVDEFIKSMNLHLTDKPYLNFARIDRLESLEGVEGIVFIGNADVISGLTAWAWYDNNDRESVSCQWSSGCSATISLLTIENRDKGKRTFLGMFDLSVRKWLKADEMSFAIPMSRLNDMAETLNKCALFNSPAWQGVKERINCFHCSEK